MQGHPHPHTRHHAGRVPDGNAAPAALEEDDEEEEVAMPSSGPEAVAVAVAVSTGASSAMLGTIKLAPLLVRRRGVNQARQ